MSTPPDSTPRRVPPPCWTREETVFLIEAYRDKWYSVNRKNLRAADWDFVAATVAESSIIHPPKSSLQCRHKIEKLRKRYRTEKQRCLSYPGRFFSSWDLFPLLDSMAIGSASSKQGQNMDESNDIGDGFRVKTLGNRYFVKPNKNSKMDQDFDPNFDLGLEFRSRKFSRIEDDPDSNISRSLGKGFYLKPVGDMNSDSFRPKDYARINGNLIADMGSHCDYKAGISMKMEKIVGDMSFLPQGYGRVGGVSNPNNRNVIGGEVADAYVGFPVKTLGAVPAGFKPKNYTNTDKNANRSEVKSDKRERFVEENVINGWVLPPAGFRPKGYSEINGRSKLNVDFKVLNRRGNVVDKTDVQGSCSKEVVDPIAEVVSAIKTCTESFVKVEKMKMEMAMEIEKMRMDMLLKHDQMIFESQKQIAEAFAKTVVEKKKKKMKWKKEMEVLSTYQNKNGDNSQVAATDSESIGQSGIVKEDCEGILLT